MSIKIKVYNQKGEESGSVDLNDAVFGQEINETLVHQAMVTQMSNERQVLSHTKTRSEVRGGGRKPWRQKGTGRARAGSRRSPIWIGGGVTFGPTKDANFKKKINKKMKQKALQMVVSDKVSNKTLIVIDKLEVEDFKTKTISTVLDSLEKKIKQDKDKKRSVLIINDKKDVKVKYSARNLVGTEIINLDNINILDLLKYRNLVITQAGIKKLEELYTK